jgi:hypothetical protein
VAHRPYPLQALWTVRRTEHERAEAALARVIAERGEARREVDAARLGLQAHREQTRGEAAAATAGSAPRTAAEAQRAEDHLRRRRQDERSLGQRLETAREALQQAEERVREARAAMAGTRTRYEAVERHRQAWLRAQRRRAALEEEQEAEDSVARGRPPELG